MSNDFPYRKSNRLTGYDYRMDGMYFVTICTQDKESYFGRVENGKMLLNKYGEIIKRQWLWLARQYRYVKLNQFAIMPNHLHGIIFINKSKIIGADYKNNVGTGRDLSLHPTYLLPPKPKSLSDIVGAFKTTSSKLIHQIGLTQFRWQRSFYDHIIRNEKSLGQIRNYIYYNPIKWETDRNNLENLLM
ncbi:MAG: transposase [Patescibacteria group bacterium]